MKEVLVLGIGNRVMMDDGIGVFVVEELDKRNSNPGIRYVVGETDVYYCLNQIDEASYIIIVDAACFDKKPGTITIIPLEQAIGNPIGLISVHESHLLNEIKMTGKSVEGLLIGIEPYTINYSFGLSPILQAQYLRIIEKIENVIISQI